MENEATDINRCAALEDLAWETKKGCAINTHHFLDNILNTLFLSVYISNKKYVLSSLCLNISGSKAGFLYRPSPELICMKSGTYDS